MIAWLWGAAALGHGGPPTSEALLWDDAGQMIVASSHGLIFSDNDWDWVCDEVFGTALPSDVVYVGDRLVVSHTGGLGSSNDGCDWTWSESFDGQMVWDLALDVEVPQRVWALTQAGLWSSTDLGRTFAFTDTPAPDASLRSFTQHPDGTWSVLGFLEGQPTAWMGDPGDWVSMNLPVSGGRLIALGTDSAGHTYGRFPLASGADELLRLGTDGTVTSVIKSAGSIDAFAAIDDVLVVSVQGEGTQVSQDHGDTWTSHSPQQLRCLTLHQGRIYACPDDDRSLLWVRAQLDLLDAPAEWTPGPGFDQVTGPRCESLLVCDAVWPDVEDELGLSFGEETTDTGKMTDAAPALRCGCGTTKATFLMPWGLLWVGQRRSSKSKPHKRNPPQSQDGGALSCSSSSD